MTNEDSYKFSDNSDSESATINDEENNESEDSMRFILTNARSLPPKITSFLDMFRELRLTFAAVTETWFKSGAQLKQELSDVEQAAGVRFLYRNRDSRVKKRGGGVALAYRTAECNLKERRIKCMGKAEVLCVTGSVGNFKKKVAIFVIYLPPSLTSSQLAAATESLANEIAAVKIALGGPAIFICGDMNGKDVQEVFDVDDGIKLIATAPTRGNSTLDLVF